MTSHPSHPPDTKPVSMPMWSRVVLALGGTVLCGFALVAFVALLSGRLIGWKGAIAAVVALGFGVSLIVGAVNRRWPNMNVGSLLP